MRSTALVCRSALGRCKSFRNLLMQRRRPPRLLRRAKGPPVAAAPRARPTARAGTTPARAPMAAWAAAPMALGAKVAVVVGAAAPVARATIGGEALPTALPMVPVARPPARPVGARTGRRWGRWARDTKARRVVGMMPGAPARAMARATPMVGRAPLGKAPAIPPFVGRVGARPARRGRTRWRSPRDSSFPTCPRIALRRRCRSTSAASARSRMRHARSCRTAPASSAL
mmetsp:Transcript_57470/g.161212  ORF Transcript_57470/g.161212 Transcript_57470/m.161212 type:complete len:229 (+) Transcript_57470:328-1014(+)